MKVCLMTCARNEDEHIQEFLEHYLDILKFDHIFWIDNNTEPLEPVVINDDRVTVVDMRHVNFDNGTEKPLKILRRTLNDVYRSHIIGSEYDWCMYADVDELLDINGEDIHSYLEKKDADTILVPWVIHSNRGYIFESELPSDRMKDNYGYDDNQHDPIKEEYKPIFKTKPYYYINIFFTKKYSIIMGCDNIIVDYDVKLHHYRIQCLETYIKHKIINGFYGHVNRARWCRNLFSSSQFKRSSVEIPVEKFDLFRELLKKYDIDKKMTDEDKNYLETTYNFSMEP